MGKEIGGGYGAGGGDVASCVGAAGHDLYSRNANILARTPCGSLRREDCCDMIHLLFVMIWEGIHLQTQIFSFFSFRFPVFATHHQSQYTLFPRQTKLQASLHPLAIPSRYHFNLNSLQLPNPWRIFQNRNSNTPINLLPPPFSFPTPQLCQHQHSRYLPSTSDLRADHAIAPLCFPLPPSLDCSFLLAFPAAGVIIPSSPPPSKSASCQRTTISTSVPAPLEDQSAPFSPPPCPSFSFS